MAVHIFYGYVVAILHLMVPSPINGVYEGCHRRSNYVDCKYKQFTAIPALVTAECVGCTVDISDNQITAIANGELPSELRALKCRWNPLDTMGDHALRDSYNTLQELDITGGNLTSIPGALTDLTNITYLTLTGHRITNTAGNNNSGSSSLAGTTFEPDYFPPSLRWVFLDNNRLTSIPPSLSKLPELQQLDVSGNNLQSIDDFVFPSYMTTVNMNRNDIQSITKLQFTNGTSNLVTFQVRDNPIHTITDHVFDILTSVRIFDLSGTNLIHLPMALLPLSHVNVINMNDSVNLTCTCDASPLRHLPFNGDCTYYIRLDRPPRKESISQFLRQNVPQCPSTTAATLATPTLPPSATAATDNTSVNTVTPPSTTVAPPTATACTPIGATPGEYFDALGTGVSEWRLAFRGVSGNNHSVYNVYNNPKAFMGNLHNDCKTVPHVGCCTKHYRNHAVLNTWANIEEVALVIYKDGKRVQYVIFDGRNSNSSNWLDRFKIINSSWTDIAHENVLIDYFSIKGHAHERRRFFMGHIYAGCDLDEGWFIAIDHSDDSTDFHGTPCSYESNHAFPVFDYATGSTYENWRHGNTDRADMMAVFVKEAQGVVG